MTFDPLATVQFHLLLGSKTRSAMQHEWNHFKFLWQVVDVHSDAFKELNQLGRSEHGEPAKVELDQNKESSQKI
jgi:hypothetical protein